jgi:hypothetical protein
MPDVQEVFRMATQKVRPDFGSMDRQEQHQRRRKNRRQTGGYVLLAVFVIAATAIGVVVTRQGQERPTPAQERNAVGSDSHPYLLDLETGDKRALLPAHVVHDLAYGPRAGPPGIASAQAYVPSPDGTRVAFSSGCEFNDAVRIVNIDGTDLQELGGTNNCGVRWSSDGTKLVYQARPGAGPCCIPGIPPTPDEDGVGNLFVHDLSTGQNTQITDLELERAHWWYLAPTFSADGQNVLFHLPRSSTETTSWDIWSVPVTGGELTLVQRDGSFPIVNPAPERLPGPDLGPSLYMQFLSPLANDLAGRSLVTGGAEPSSELAPAIQAIRWPTVSPNGYRIAYQDGGSIYVVLLPRQGIDCCQVTRVDQGSTAEWLDNDTLVVTP